VLADGTSFELSSVLLGDLRHSDKLMNSVAKDASLEQTVCLWTTIIFIHQLTVLQCD
jgi:hypothetical protein